MNESHRAYLAAFGIHLKQVIDRRGITPATLAAHAGLETKTIYRVINGEHSTTLSTIYAIAQALEIEPKKLFEFEFKK